MPKKLIPDHKVRQMLRAGRSHREIVDALAREDNIYITHQAISAWARRNGLDVDHRRRTGYPWRIAPEHRHMIPVRAIQWYNRREMGDKLSPTLERRLESILAKLREKDAVFHYDADTVEGWWTVPRRDGDHPLYRNIDND